MKSGVRQIGKTGAYNVTYNYALSSIYSFAFALNYLQKGIMQKSKSK